MKYTTLDNATKQGFELSQYQQRDLNKEVESLLSFKPFCEIIPMVYFSEYDNKIHFEHVFIVLKYKDTLIKPFKYYNEKSFKFFLLDEVYCKGFETKLIEPNRIGVATAKKLDNWLSYLLEVNKEKTEILAQRNNKETEFLNKIKNCGLKVNWHKEGKSGYIYHKDFEYSFEILNDGYINESMRYRGGQKIDDLLKL